MEFKEWLEATLKTAGDDKEALRKAGSEGARIFGRVPMKQFMAMPHPMRTAYSRALNVAPGTPAAARGAPAAPPPEHPQPGN